jgi:biopolymer transport protein ExbB/TolQ
MSVSQNYVRDRVTKLAVLAVIAVVVQLLYASYVRPTAEQLLTEQRAIAASDPTYVPPRSFWVTIRDAEQQVTIIVAIWALILSGLRFRELKAQRELLEAGFLKREAGVVILPSDAREYLRTFEQLPPQEQNSVLPRVLAAALKRFGATGNVQDASQAVHNTCESEHNRLDAELAMLRFSVWVAPALGFIGTVRGIGIALQGAELAVRGETTAVTNGLGIAFNSTLVALVLSIILMYVLHEIQLTQERLVLDTENYAEEELVSRLHSGTD